MLSKFLKILCVPSLILCAGFIAIWVRSYWHVDYYSWQDERRITAPKFPPGFSTTLPDARRMPITSIGIFYDPKPLIAWDHGWIMYTRNLSYDPTTGTYIKSSADTEIWLPCWLCVLVTGGFAAWARALAKQPPQHDAARDGLCPKCAYDLRASTDRCPECGWLQPK
jgi:hypothetical protein